MHDDGFAAGFRVHFHFRARDVDFTATGAVGLFNAATAVDNGGGREIRAGICAISPSMLMSSSST